jgi:hypothetical protein
MTSNLSLLNKAKHHYYPCAANPILSSNASNQALEHVLQTIGQLNIDLNIEDMIG